MKRNILLLFTIILFQQLNAQLEPNAGKWKPWFITSVQAHRLPAPVPNKNEINEVLAAQKNMNDAKLQQIQYWNAGPPSYRWQEMINKLWVVDTSYSGALSNMVMNTAVYDATLVAWDTKYAFKRARPYNTDKRVILYVLRPESPSYPCEHSVAAGAASTVIAHFYPKLKDSVMRMATQAMESRIAAGVSFPGDTKAGFALGQKIALEIIDRTKDYTPQTPWDRVIPNEPGKWTGRFAYMPIAGKMKTVVLKSGSELRPPPPPDWTKDMEELKNFKRNFRSNSNAYLYASATPGDDLLKQKVFEYNLHLNPPRAARIYAASAVAFYDAFIACWDAKYAYWGIRPDQFDTTYKPLIASPPFPGYPSGHATIGGVAGELYSYFFPADKATFEKNAQMGAESRFHAGIHFRTDNEVGLEMGRQVARKVIARLRSDGADVR